MTDPRRATAAYETWLGERIPLVAADIEAKHAEMAADELRFLRGTYYLWLLRLATVEPKALDGPTVPCVGDVHIENFGTWRDASGARRWGVNDFDEIGWGPYALDLLRLATSAVVTPHVTLQPAQICDIVLETWRSASPRAAIELDKPSARHLAALVPEPKSAKQYFAALRAGATVRPDTIPDAVRRAAAATAPPGWSPAWHDRRAGTGSLGHPRYAAVDGDPTATCREVKLLGPPTVEWVGPRLEAEIGARLPVADETILGRVLQAIHGPDPMRRIGGWQIRRLAPDVQRIEISRLDDKDASRVIRSMGRAIVDVAGTHGEHLAAARTHEAKRRPHWLHKAVEAMAADLHDQWKRYRAGD